MVPVSFAFDFCGREFVLTKANAVYWPAERALLVADLHLEKASFFASHGQLLPPYDSRETLDRLAQAVRQFDARRVITLGDNFHDSAGSQRLEDRAASTLDDLTRTTDWLWITGNHDPSMEAKSGGAIAQELEVSGVILRHMAKKGEARPELSGHFHPRVQMKVRQRHIRRACAVVGHNDNDSGRMILPAFGAFTGGMNAADPVIVNAMQPASQIDALVPTTKKLARFPLWREKGQSLEHAPA